MLISWQKIRLGFKTWMLFHICIATIIIMIQFWGLGHDAVLLIHDQYFPLTGYQAIANLDILSNLNSGTPNGFLFAINGFDSLLFSGLYGLGLNSQQVEMVYLSLLLSIALILIHWGFYRLIENCSYAISMAPTYAFALSPFYLILYNTGIFWSIMSMLAMSILPLAVAVFRDLLSSTTYVSRQSLRKDIALFGICLAIYGFVTPYAIPVGVILLGFLIIFSISLKTEVFWKNFTQRVIPASAISIFLILAPVFAGYIERYSFGYTFIEGPLANSTSGLIQGGILTPMLRHASWAIYTLWSPRVFLAFPSHFTSPLYFVLTIAELIMVVVIFVSLKGSDFLRACWIGLLVSLFLAKGSSKPFGELFDYALQKISIFGLIRSPDSKFGLAIAFLIIAMLFWGFSEFLKNKYRIAAVICFIVLMALPCVNAGILIKRMVIRGESGEMSIKGNYALPLDESFMETVNFINGLSHNSAIYFKTWDGSLNTSLGFITINKDPLADFVKQPVYFNGDKSVTAGYISELVTNYENTEDLSYLRPAGIRYLVVNLRNEKLDRQFVKRLAAQSVREVFKNNQYIIFQINGVNNISPVEVRSEGNSIESEIVYRKIFDTAYEINLDMLPSESFDLILKTGKSKNWHAFIANNFWEVVVRSITDIFGDRTIKETCFQGDYMIHKQIDSDTNHWLVKRQHLNMTGIDKHGDNHEKIFLVFIPQIFLFFLIISGGIIFLLVMYFFCFRKPMILKKCKSNI